MVGLYLSEKGSTLPFLKSLQEYRCRSLDASVAERIQNLQTMVIPDIISQRHENNPVAQQPQYD
jgi:hypothetical protein